MPEAGPISVTRGRILLATVITVLTVATVWIWMDYRLQPPLPVPAAVGSE
jgi:hypothetical protein